MFNEGDIVQGTVTGIEDYGIFLSFDNNQSGLVHISEISDSFVKNVSDYAKIGDNITVKVLSVDEDGHYKLSIKELDCPKKNASNHINETNGGFNTLGDTLSSWIEEAYTELEKK